GPLSHRMKQSLALRVGQTLTMTPALQQAIRLLQLSSMDLQQEIQQALESNVMLEVDEPEVEAPIEEVAVAEPQLASGEGETAEKPAAEERQQHDEELRVEMDWDTDGSYETAGSGSRDAADEEELHEFRQANLHSGVTLREHLLWQARL